MNLEEFSYQFGVNGAENLIAKLNQIETETENLDNAAEHLGNTFQKLFDYYSYHFFHLDFLISQ